MRSWPLVFIALCGACGIVYRPPSVFSFAVTVQVRRIRNGVARYYIHVPIGPWAIHVLDITMRQRGACYAGVAVKGADGAMGVGTTTSLLRDLDHEREVIAGINADFFDGLGVPRGLLVSHGRVITGPSTFPALALDSSGTPQIANVHVNGHVILGGRTYDINGWNRPVPSGLAFFDAGWDRSIDKDTAAVAVVLSGRHASRVMGVDTAATSVPIPDTGAVLIAGRDAPIAVREALRALHIGDDLRVDVSLTPLHPLEAISGYPILLRDSVVPEAVENSRSGFVTGRNPRSAIGIIQGGKRLLLVVVDGRQKSYSDGMTLHELAQLMLALGARDAINLDGGGSTTLVYAETDSAHTLHVVNRSSDGMAGLRPMTNFPDTSIGVRPGKSMFVAAEASPVGIPMLIREHTSLPTALSSGRYVIMRRMKFIREATPIAKPDTVRKILPYQVSPGWQSMLALTTQTFPVYAYLPSILPPAERMVGDALAIVRGCPAR